MTTDYDLGNIRALLTEGFTDEELRSFCFDVPEFKPVYEQFTQGTSKGQIVQLIMEHAERKSLMKILLDWTAKKNPAKYKEYQPHFYEGGRIEPSGNVMLVEDRDASRPEIYLLKDGVLH